MPTTSWTRDHLSLLQDDPTTATAVIGSNDVRPLVDGLHFWDLWPVRTPAGEVASWCGREVWAGLSARAVGHPGDRHDVARIRLVARTADGWDDLGPLFPDGASLGSREWAGTLVLHDDGSRIEACYTAAGWRDEPERTFHQRIVGTGAPTSCGDAGPVVGEWEAHVELVRPDGVRYQPADEAGGVPGFIKAFRDPFRIDLDGESWMLFTGSVAHAQHPDFNGLVGLARATSRDEHGVPSGWELLDPLVTADGVNNELERPHVVRRDGLVYLFISTQARTFDPAVNGPTGLYGFVADAITGPFRPLNGSGLVLRNPVAEPFQAYSWFVLPDLTTVGFVDAWGLAGRHPDELEAEGADAVRRHFGGTMTPPVRLVLDGDRASVHPV
jgi:levansucrase